ncbi:hypothetical protein [Streptomyces huiliensis]|uniref:hypothetical protein n=1 Tax=Streptomyces huiliensis TaxID=2876027 RepID=UPI001CC157C3|nr:hypothetical protein [Streptomyces huiliensis]MBZ4319953.1 hypothetical protein [Streptomyces huiliensis]
MSNVLDCGFAWCCLSMLVVTASVHVVGGCFHALTLTGTATVMVPEEPVQLSLAWHKAALDTLRAAPGRSSCTATSRPAEATPPEQSRG